MNTQNDYVRLTIRVPPELNDALKELASISERSLNSEIVSRLADSIKLEQADPTNPKASIKMAAEKIAIIAKQIALASEDTGTSPAPKLNKEEVTKLLGQEEQQLLNWFKSAKDSEKSLIISSLPELISLLTKIVQQNR